MTTVEGTIKRMWPDGPETQITWVRYQTDGGATYTFGVSPATKFPYPKLKVGMRIRVHQNGALIQKVENI